MRGATECAKRVKLVFSSLRAKLGKVGHPPVTDPITQLVLGILSRDTPEAKASEGLERLRGMVVDYNELRVIPPIELSAILHDFPDARLKCEDISRALNAVFALEHGTLLDRLAGLPRKEALILLDRIDGLEPYTRARIRLLGLQHHAIPLDEAMWATARADGLVDARCPLQEAQQFLERQVAEEDALEFVALFKRHAWNEMGAAVKRHEVERIQSVPPDRTSRNMLQMVTSAASLGVVDDLGEETDDALGLAVGPALDDDEEALVVAPAPRAARPSRPASKSRRTSAAEGRRTSRTPNKPSNAKPTAAAAPKVAPKHRAAAAAPPRGSAGKRAASKAAKSASGSRARKSKSA